MKKLLAVVPSLLAILGMYSCDRNKKPDLRLSTYVYQIDVDDRDRLYEGSTIISNRGKGKLMIDYVNTGCSCTNAVFHKRELNHKDTTEIRFSYDPRGKSPGRHEQFIVIKANTDSLVHLMKLVVDIKE